MNHKNINRNVWALTLALCIGVLFMLTTTWAAEQKPAVPKIGVTKIGKITINQKRATPRQQPVVMMIEVTCNGGSTVITCPDGMTAACSGVIAEYCH